MSPSGDGWFGRPILRPAKEPPLPQIQHPAGHPPRGRYDKQVCRVRDLSLAGWRIYLEYERWRVNCPGCGGLHVEHLDWLANNSRYT